MTEDTRTFPPAEQHAKHADVAPAWLALAEKQAAAGQLPMLPLTNAAAVFAAVANLDPKGDCRYRALRVSSPFMSTWDPTPVVAFGLPGSTQTREGVPGVVWPIYSRDMPVAKGCTQFLVALATGQPTPVLATPKQTSGLWEALRLGVTPLELGPDGSTPPADPHGVVVNARMALVWVQAETSELVNGEPQYAQPQPVAVDLTVPLSTLVGNPTQHMGVPPGLEALRDCIVARLTKLRMPGRRAGTGNAKKEKTDTGADAALTAAVQRAERAEAEVLRLQQDSAATARLYAEQLQTLGQGSAPTGVPVDACADYLASMLGYLQPGAPFNDLAARIRSGHPALFEAIARRLQGGT